MTNHPSPSRTPACRALIFVGTLVLASAGRESIGDDQLTNSNVLGQFTGPSWATVTLAQAGAGVVKFTVTPNNNTGVYVQPLGPRFGVTKFTFNTISTFTIVASDITVPAGCSAVGNPSGDPFGQFNWEVTSNVAANPLIFTVTKTGVNPNSFQRANSPNNATFSAFIGGFTVSSSNVTSHWVSEGGTIFSPVVVPTKPTSELLWVIVGVVILAVIAIAYLVLKKYWARRSS
jgi:hypothetical protein